jgi:hypothetical protein
MLIQIVAAAMLLSTGEPDGIVTTAPNGTGAIPVGAEAPTPTQIQAAGPSQALTAHGLTTDEQIDAWIASRNPEARPFAEAVEPWLKDDREVHGEVSAAVGTGDYSAFSGTVSLPVGETGRMNLSYSQSKNGYGYGYPYGGYGYGSPFGYDSAFGYPGRSLSSGWRRERVFEQDRSPRAEN